MASKRRRKDGERSGGGGGGGGATGAGVRARARARAKATAIRKAEPTGAERAAKVSREAKNSPLHHIRRQAARVLQTILQGDAHRHALASVKSLIYQPSVRNKKATMALTCQTLRYLPIIKDVLTVSDLLNTKIKVQRELLYVMTFELLFGKELVSPGAVESIVLSRKSSLRAALARMLVKRNVSNVEDLLPADKGGCGPATIRYVRVNSLKMEVDKAVEALRKFLEVKRDDLIPGLLTVPARTDLHRHPLVLNGALILQGKASCMPALALAPDADWEVLDACAAPGNKTVQLAALMKGRGKVLACEVNENRLKRLYETVRVAGASNVEVWHQDFLKIDPNASSFAKVRAILLDPSCSGSGTAQRRLDHLLPSSAIGQNHDALEMQRIERLACFQEKALRLALSFPAVERVVYSTCSIHQRENEDVVQSVLAHASSHNFQLGTPFPNWEQRGLPVFEGAHHLLRIEPTEDLEGFFVALFERQLQNSEMDTRCTDSLIATPDFKDKEREFLQCSKQDAGLSKASLRPKMGKHKRRKQAQ